MDELETLVKTQHGNVVESKCLSCRFYKRTDSGGEFCKAYMHSPLYLLEHGINTEECGEYEPIEKKEEEPIVEEETEVMMTRPIIKNKEWKAIAKAAKEGNPRALGIVEKYGSKELTQEELDKMLQAFFAPEAEPIAVEEDVTLGLKNYGVKEEEPVVKEEEVAVEEAPVAEEEKPAIEEKPEELKTIDESKTPVDTPVVDISALLDKDLDGIIDKKEIEDMDFSIFIKNKKKDNMRARKGHDHFSTYDADGRADYLTKKEDEYGHSFDNSRKNIERKFKDMDGAISGYLFSVNSLPDDASEVDDIKVSELYDKLTDSDEIMGAFGRSWDEEDTGAMKATLETLVQEYGKANVLAVLNSLKSDNCAFRDFRCGQIDEEVKRYNKSLEELLK